MPTITLIYLIENYLVSLGPTHINSDVLNAFLYSSLLMKQYIIPTIFTFLAFLGSCRNFPHSLYLIISSIHLVKLGAISENMVCHSSKISLKGLTSTRIDLLRSWRVKLPRQSVWLSILSHRKPFNGEFFKASYGLLDLGQILDHWGVSSFVLPFQLVYFKLEVSLEYYSLGF